MERRLYAAAVEGNTESLDKLLEEDELALDRYMAGCYSETPLHVASMLGHVQFVQSILRRKPELAGELDSRRSSPLHLAAAAGYLDIVLELANVNSEMCYACDRDGKNPLHIAAIKGHVNVLKELMRVRPEAARTSMARSETILHACVNYNQLEAMKLLVSTNDGEFLNSKNENGNTILHLAVIDKQVETVEFLTASTPMDVNAMNQNGLTALEILAQSKRDVRDWDIGEKLRCAGGKSRHDSTNISTVTAPTGSTSSTLRVSSGSSSDKKEKKWLKDMRSALMVVATLIAAAAYQAALYPPGGSWQQYYKVGDHNNFDDIEHFAGYSILADNDPRNYGLFYLFNTIAWFASLSIILLLISGLPFVRRKFFIWILMVTMWIAISAMIAAYWISAVNLLSDTFTLNDFYIEYLVYVWVVLVEILILAQITRLLCRVIRKRKELSSTATSSSVVNGGHEPPEVVTV